MDIINATGELTEHIQGYYGQKRMLVVILFCALIAYLYFPKLKRIILYPTLLIVLLLLNPVLYELVFSKIIYWRLLWMIPGTYLIAYVICQIYRVRKSTCMRVFFLVSLCLCVAFSGNYAYSNDRFQKTQNLEKIDSGVKEVGDIILENCEKPVCLVRAKYLTQIRQYSVDIELLYGRNVYNNYITGSSDRAKRVAYEMEKKNPDYALVLDLFKKNLGNVIVVKSKYPIPDELLRQYGLHELARADESIIYKKEKK